MRLSFALLTALAAIVAAGASGAAAAPISDCTGAQLHGTFAAVPGSAGAGNISYKLTLKNISTSPCSITGLPVAQLLGKHGGKLPTHVQAASKGMLTAIFVRLQPGQSTKATARFSPDVPGTGEPVSGTNCEPVAYSLRVTAPGGGTTTAKILPPTSVCEHGRLMFSGYGR
jgi:hypothetical protein